MYCYPGLEKLRVIKVLDSVQEWLLVEHSDQAANRVVKTVKHRFLLCFDKADCLQTDHSDISELLVAQSVLHLGHRCFVFSCRVNFWRIVERLGEHREDYARQTAEQNFLLVSLAVFSQSNRSQQSVSPAFRLSHIDLEVSRKDEKLLIGNLRPHHDVTSAHNQEAPEKGRFCFRRLRSLSFSQLCLQILKKCHAVNVIGQRLKLDVREQMYSEEEIVVDQEVLIEGDLRGSKALECIGPCWVVAWCQV